VADILAIMIKRAKNNDQIEGVIMHLVEGWFSILWYADNTILEHDLEKARNLKLILSAFRHLLGLKLNFHKEWIVFLWRGQDVATQYAKFSGVDKGSSLLSIFIYRYITRNSATLKYMETYWGDTTKEIK
jgi:hypothetical protein